MLTNSPSQLYEETWANLPFSGFDPAQLKKRRKLWQDYAAQILGLLPSGNVGLVADTSAGKTVICSLVIVAGNYRTIVLAPRRILAEKESHPKLFGMVTGISNSQTITGSISAEKRNWQTSALVIFATPHVLLNDFLRGKVNLKEFDLVVFDEFHHATGKYPYVPLAKIAQDFKLPILGLSASPGGDLPQIEMVQKNCGIIHWVGAKIPTAKKTEILTKVEVTSVLKEIEELFMPILGETALELKSYRLKFDLNKLLLTARELGSLDQQINKMPRDEDYYQALSAAARYRKLLHALRCLMTESFETFLEFVKELKEHSESKANHWILDKQEFQKAVEIAERERDNHPKVAKLVEVANYLVGKGENGLIFINNKKTGLYLLKVFKKEGLRVAVLFGGADRKLTQQAEVLEQIGRRQLDFVICTSVIEEGVSVPEVDTVINYSLPQTEIARLQRAGRTARIRSGTVIYLAVDHYYDRATYWGVWRRLTVMKQIVAGNSAPQVPRSLNRKIRVKKRCPATLELALGD